MFHYPRQEASTHGPFVYWVKDFVHRLKIARKEALGTPPYIFLGVVEALAGFAVIIGFRYQFAVLVFIVAMFGAIFTKLFFWKNQSYVSNIEYDVLILAASLIILVFGPGIFALTV